MLKRWVWRSYARLVHVVIESDKSWGMTMTIPHASVRCFSYFGVECANSSLSGWQVYSKFLDHNYKFGDDLTFSHKLAYWFSSTMPQHHISHSIRWEQDKKTLNIIVFVVIHNSSMKRLKTILEEDKSTFIFLLILLHSLSLIIFNFTLWSWFRA